MVFDGFTMDLKTLLFLGLTVLSFNVNINV